MSRRAVTALGVLGLALAGAGGAARAQEPCDPTPGRPCATPTPSPTVSPSPSPSPPPAAARVRLTARPGAAVFDGRRGGVVTLGGRLVSTAAVAGVRVELLGRSTTFHRVTIRRTVTTDAGGAFRLRVRPTVNARYVASIAAGQGVTGASPSLRVRAFPRTSVVVDARDAAARLLFTVRGPRRLVFEDGFRRPRAGSAQRAFFYVRLRGEQRFRRVGRGALSGVRCKTTCVRTASFTLEDPRTLRRTRSVGGCIRGAAFKGLGASADCGERRRAF